MSGKTRKNPTGRDFSRAKDLLKPATLRYRKDTGRYFFDFNFRGKRYRQSLSTDLDESVRMARELRSDYLARVGWEQRHLKSTVSPTDNGQVSTVTETKHTAATSGNIVATSLPASSPTPVPTFREFYDSVKAQRQEELAPNTWSLERVYLRQITENFLETPLDAITAPQVNATLATVSSPSTKVHVARLLRTILRRAVAEGIISKSPFRYVIKKPHPRTVNLEIISVGQLRDLCEAAPRNLQAAFALAAFCGLRRGEIMALRISDLHLDQQPRVVSITKAAGMCYGQGTGISPRHEKSTKNKRFRSVPIPAIAVPFLEVAIAGKERTDLLYPTFQSDLSFEVKATCRKIGLSASFTFHDLRHMFASHLTLKAGLEATKEALGHSSIVITSDTYAHFSVGQLGNAVETAFAREEEVDAQRNDDARRR